MKSSCRLSCFALSITFLFLFLSNLRFDGVPCVFAATTIGPVSISQSSDDGYSWGKYGDTWSNHNTDFENIRFGGASDEDRMYVSSFMFRNIDIPAGQNIIEARLIFSPQDYHNDSASVNLEIAGIDPASQDTFSPGNMGQTRDQAGYTVLWNKSLSSVQTPDIASIVQAIVNDTDWRSGNAMGFVIKNSGSAGAARHNICSWDNGDPATVPKLMITYGEPPADLTAPVISMGHPAGILSPSVTTAQLRVVTDEDAICRYDTRPDTRYDDMAMSFSMSGGQLHTATITDLTEGTHYSYCVKCMDSSGNQTSADYNIEFSIADSQGLVVRLNVEEPAGVARTNEPLRAGIPFPRGLVNPSDNLKLMAGEQELLLQKKILSVWEDGSIRWLLLDTLISLEPYESKDVDIVRTPVPSSVSNPITIQDDADFIIVDTGPLKVEIPKNNGSLINRAWHNGALVIDTPSGDAKDRGAWVTVDGNSFYSSLLQRDSSILSSDPVARYKEYVSENGNNFNLYDPWDLSVTIEEQGPLHAVIRVSGSHLDDTGMGFSSFISRIHAYKGDARLRVDHTLVYTGTGNDKIQSYGVRIPFAGTTTIIEGLPVSEDGFVLHLGYDAHTVSGIHTEGRAKGYALRGNGLNTMGVVLRDMAQNYPKGVKTNPSGIEVQLYPDAAPPLDLSRYSFDIDTGNGETGGVVMNRAAQGLSKTDTFYLAFGDGAVNQVAIENMAAAVGAGNLFALAAPDWYSDARVMGIGDFVFETSPAASELNYRIDGVLNILEDFMRYNQREQFKWFGMTEYGDIRGWFNGGCAPGSSADCTWSELGRYGWSGNSGEPSNQLWVQFLREQRHDLFRDAQALARHTLDLQMVHYGDATKHGDTSMEGGRNREFSVGSLHRHGRQAWSGYAQQPEYVHIAGIETYYYLTGDNRAKEALFEAGSFLARYSTGSPGHTALVNGIDSLSRISAVFYDDPIHYDRFNNRLDVLIDHLFTGSPNRVVEAISGKTLGGTFDYFIRGAGGLLYHHERTRDADLAHLILDAADIITSGQNNDYWGVGESGEAGSVWYYLNSLTYAAAIATEYGRLPGPYFDLVKKVVDHNGHWVDQQGSSAISLDSFAAIPEDWTNWVWEWDDGPLNPEAPALLHIARQLTYRNDFMQDYHSYRAFIHLATAAALMPLENGNLCPGDSDNDLDVDGLDLSGFIIDFGLSDCAGNCTNDLDVDGDIDRDDLEIMAGNLGKRCGQ